MSQSKDDPRMRFIVHLVSVLAALIIGLAVIFVFANQASLLTQVILSASVLLAAVLTVALGYNVFAKVKDARGNSGQVTASRPEGP